jgi:hypothetical protein
LIEDEGTDSSAVDVAKDCSEKCEGGGQSRGDMTEVGENSSRTVECIKDEAKADSENSKGLVKCMV